MDSLASLLAQRQVSPQPGRKPNTTWQLAAKVADVTGEPIQWWLKRAKADTRHLERALIAIDELPSHNKAAHFKWWYKRYKNAERSSLPHQAI